MSPEAFDATYEAACVTFTYRRLDGEEVELKPGGASLPLTFDTREEWCALIEEARRRAARRARERRREQHVEQRAPVPRAQRAGRALVRVGAVGGGGGRAAYTS